MIHPRTRSCTLPALFALILATFLPLAHAQNVTGTITGTVHDASGAVVSGASISIVNTDRNQEVRKLSSDTSGFYSAPQLPIGLYKVSVEAQGFKQHTVDNIKLNVNDTLTINVALEVGSSAQSITVSASAIQVDTQSASNGTLINSTQIAQLPLNNRNYEQLVALQPGVAYGGGDQLYIGLSNPSGQSNVVNFSINGQRNSTNNWTVDGADNVDRGSNSTLLIYPSVDAIAEFKTIRNAYSAEFGRSASGQINVVTKSGTHDFHGSAYEFFRNDILNANSFFNNYSNTKRPPLRYNDFGYSIGGPVWVPKVYNKERDKTFFFFSQEFRRVITYAPLVFDGDPTAAQRSGTFANPVCVDANCTASTTQVANISPAAQAYLKDVWAKIPLPNDPGNPNGLIVSERNVYNGRQEIARIDHHFSPKLDGYFRFENDSIPTTEPGGLFSGAGFPGVGVTNTNAPGRNYLGHATYVFSPTFLFDIGYAYSTGAIISDPVGLMARANSPDVNPTLPFTSSLARIPALTFEGGTSLTSFGPYRDFNRDHNPFLNATKILGRHSLRFGVTYHHYEKTENAGGNNASTFAFTGDTTPDGSAATNFEQSFANFLQGNVASFTQDSHDITPDIITNQAEGYIQDDWKVSPKLTVNAGVRYSWFQQPIDANQRLTNFDPRTYVAANAPAIDSGGNICTAAPCAGGASPNPGYNPLNGIIVANVNSPYGSRVAPQSWLDFAPRFGFAYDAYGNGKTAIRGGYGIAYDSSLFGTYEQNIFANPPYVQSINIPTTNFDNPGAGTPSISALPLTVHATPYQVALPYSQQFSLGVQQEVAPSTVAEINYVGSTGTHLLGIADINQPLPGAYVAAGIAAPGGINRGNTQLLNQIRPYKGYGPINALETWYTSNYHSLQAQVRKRFSDGSLVDLNYTWSKGLTNNQSDRSNAVQNIYNIHGEYGRTVLDRRNIFSADFVYNLPFFRDPSSITGRLLGGWQLAGIVLANSGLPLTATTSADPAGLGLLNSASVAGARPDQVGNPNQGAPHKLLNWFNTDAFANVPAGQVRAGNEHRGVIGGPGFQRWDLALYKKFAFTESTGVQLRWETFNTFNHTNFDTVSTSLTSSAYGHVTGTRDPRIMQIAAKFYF